MKPAEASAPLASPRALERAGVASAVFLSEAVCAVIWSAGFGWRLPLPLAALLAAGAVLTVLAARHVLRADSPRAVLGRSLGDGALFGAAASVLLTWLAVISGAFAGGHPPWGTAVLASLASIFVGMPGGAGLGFVWYLALAPVARARSERSEDAGEGIAAGVAWALLLGGAFARYVSGAAGVRLGGVGLASVGVALLALTLARDVRRRAWLGAVRRGEVADARVRPREAPADGAACAPLFAEATRLRPDEVIERLAREETTPFRAQARWTPVALAHSSASGADHHANTRVVFAVVGLLAGALALIKR